MSILLRKIIMFVFCRSLFETIEVQSWKVSAWMKKNLRVSHKIQALTLKRHLQGG